MENAVTSTVEYFTVEVPVVLLKRVTLTGTAPAVSLNVFVATVNAITTFVLMMFNVVFVGVVNDAPPVGFDSTTVR